MARISGVELQDNWRVEYALTNIKGIGMSLSKKILGELKLEKDKRISELTSDEIAKIAGKIEEYPTEGDLIRKVRSNISRLTTIGSYRGLRHTRGLPVRGQRTRSNARTKRGKRKTVGAFKKETLTQTQQKQKEE
uniref:Small ribosomal subunit protein uS13 n=1 Tax=uncultured Microgenomates bacterium Rifle_16ft_4_minimus_38077 TaxID=1665117 RepID=A0A0H4T6Q9_9BACT|nr:30S ribosomal protein S13, small subunit ribosomal protein S13 [uncultured Microgenomates bacterium Rifle_16ft_4_minimus_38077]